MESEREAWATGGGFSSDVAQNPPPLPGFLTWSPFDQQPVPPKKMPPLPGEERLLTTYADVHYYFSSPSPHPRQDRFDRGSYLYVYHDGAQNKSRIEIANNPGTPEIDAFCGSLESVHIDNSDEFLTRCTLTVDGRRQSASSVTPTQTADPNDWRLAYMNSQDGSRDHLRLHTLDIYFWSLDDVDLFLATVRRLLGPSQLDVASSAQQERAMSSVVQQLENVAVSDQKHGDRQITTPISALSNIPPPPPAVSNTATPPPHRYTTSRPVSPLEESAAQVPSKSSEPTQSYAPLAYNPAAPAAPEPVKHREKTPPPPDAAAGTGLGNASFGPPSQPSTAQHPSQGYPAASMPYSSPPPSAGLSQPGQMPPYITHHNSSGSLSFAPPPAAVTTSAPVEAGSQPSTMTFAPPPQDHASNFHPNVSAPGGQPGPMAFSPPPQDPSMHFNPQLSFGHQSMTSQYTPTQQAHYLDRRASQPATQQPPIQTPVGGYIEYSYNQNNQISHSANPYDIHAQVYRPSEAEAVGHYKDTHSDYTQGGRKPGKITENAMRVEKGVNRLFKKLEKRL